MGTVCPGTLRHHQSSAEYGRGDTMKRAEEGVLHDAISSQRSFKEDVLGLKG